MRLLQPTSSTSPPAAPSRHQPAVSIPRLWAAVGLLCASIATGACSRTVFPGGGPGGNGASSGEAICSPGTSDRPNNCEFEGPLVYDTAKDFEKLCNTTCSRIRKMNVCLGESLCDSSGEIASVASIPPMRGIERATSSVVIRGGPELGGLEFLGDLEFAGSFRLIDNTSLESLQGLTSLETISGTLVLRGNSRLRTTKGLEPLRKFGYLEVVDNPNLDSLEGLRNARLYDNGPGRRGLRIVGNSALQNLDGLQGVSGIDQNLVISNNDTLESLEGLDNLDRVGDAVEIVDNRSLPTCEAEALVQRIDVSGPVTIEGNGSGDCS